MLNLLGLCGGDWKEGKIGWGFGRERMRFCNFRFGWLSLVFGMRKWEGEGGRGGEFRCLDFFIFFGGGGRGRGGVGLEGRRGDGGFEARGDRERLVFRIWDFAHLSLLGLKVE